MSSHGVAAVTRIAGDTTGTFLSDLTSPNVGQWPKDVAIVRITRIVVYTGAIVDSVRVTYLLTNSQSITVQHGGTGGKVALDFTLSVTQKIVAVYGRRLNGPSPYGKKNIVQLSFIIGTSGADGKGAATCDVKTATAGDVTSANTQFDFSWALVGVVSYTDKPNNAPNSYLQGLGFTKVFSQAAGPI